MAIASAVLNHDTLSKKAKLKFISLIYKNVKFNKISKNKTEILSHDYKSVQNVVMTYIGTNDSDIADAIIYAKNN